MSYAGDVSPQQTWESLASDPEAVLVDVRTDAELTFVGRPDLSSLGKQQLAIQWTGYPGGERNANFLRDLEGQGVTRETPVYFLCRSGVRSVAAATEATAAGWRAAYSIIDGFEGGFDDEGRRSVAGWKVAGLPWRQD